MNTFEKFSLEGKVAVVTGATRGIGQAIAEGLASAGADIVGVGRSSHEETERKVTALGRRYHAIAVGVEAPDAPEKIIREAVETFGKVDILVNAAGTTHREMALDVKREDWQRVLDINLTAAFFLCQQAARQFIAQGGGGKIINIASIHAFVSRLGYNTNAYCAAKGGLLMLTKSLAQEWAKYNITVNAIGPGYFPSELTGAYIDTPEFKKVCETYSPMGRPGITGEMDGLCIYLASDASSFTTGQMIAMDGGWLTI